MHRGSLFAPAQQRPGSRQRGSDSPDQPILPALKQCLALPSGLRRLRSTHCQSLSGRSAFDRTAEAQIHKASSSHCTRLLHADHLAFQVKVEAFLHADPRLPGGLGCIDVKKYGQPYCDNQSDCQEGDLPETAKLVGIRHRLASLVDTTVPSAPLSNQSKERSRWTASSPHGGTGRPPAGAQNSRRGPRRRPLAPGSTLSQFRRRSARDVRARPQCAPRPVLNVYEPLLCILCNT